MFGCREAIRETNACYVVKVVGGSFMIQAVLDIFVIFQIIFSLGICFC